MQPQYGRRLGTRSSLHSATLWVYVLHPSTARRLPSASRPNNKLTEGPGRDIAEFRRSYRCHRLTGGLPVEMIPSRSV